MKKLLLLLLCFSIFSLLQAQIDYIGPNPGTWNKASNWSSGKVPAYGDYVRILTGDSVEIKKGYHAQVKELEIEAGAGMLIRKGGSLTSSIGASNNGNSPNSILSIFTIVEIIGVQN